MANPKPEKCFLGHDKDGLITEPQSNVSDAKVDYADDGSADDLDTDAKRVAAMNAANGKINSILDILEAHGLMKDS